MEGKPRLCCRKVAKVTKVKKSAELPSSADPHDNTSCQGPVKIPKAHGCSNGLTQPTTEVDDYYYVQSDGGLPVNKSRASSRASSISSWVSWRDHATPRKSRAIQRVRQLSEKITGLELPRRQTRLRLPDVVTRRSVSSRSAVNARGTPGLERLFSKTAPARLASIREGQYSSGTLHFPPILSSTEATAQKR
ncbi:hypothetical protein Bbelb_171750 [Branchiostoma belcheri]|nr:hypothetical protein Bbelb_171750 [Branchiostoma belcheri]